MNWFFTADQHLGHENIIKYCNRPFASVNEMDEELIKRHNEVVSKKDIVIVAGDFTLSRNKDYINSIIKRLKGQQIFLRGSHDYWLPKSYPFIYEKKINDQFIVVCHYAMRTWARSHYNSWQLYGHSHGTVKGIGKQMDIGVDTHNFYPYSFEEIKEIMDKKEDNFNLINNSRIGE